MRTEDNTENTKPADKANPEVELEMVIRMLRQLAVSDVAPEAALATLAVAALMPVIQATMSFTLAAANNYRLASAEFANLAATTPPILAQSVSAILNPPEQPTRIVTRTVVRDEAQQLAVT